MDMYFILGKRYNIMVYAATSYTRPETASLLFPLERIEEISVPKEVYIENYVKILKK